MTPAQERAEQASTAKPTPPAAQGEYVACRQAGIPFAAANGGWHWYDGANRVLYTREVMWGKLGDLITTKEVDGCDWPAVAAKVLA